MRKATEEGEPVTASPGAAGEPKELQLRSARSPMPGLEISSTSPPLPTADQFPSGRAGAPPQAMAGLAPGPPDPAFGAGNHSEHPVGGSCQAYEVAVGRGTGRNIVGSDRDSKQNSMTRTDKKSVRTALHPPSGFAPSAAESRRRVAG